MQNVSRLKIIRGLLRISCWHWPQGRLHARRDQRSYRRFMVLSLPPRQRTGAEWGQGRLRIRVYILTQEQEEVLLNLSLISGTPAILLPPTSYSKRRRIERRWLRSRMC